MEFQELEWMSAGKISRKYLRGSVTLNGLWRYQSATWKSPLFAVDPVTGRPENARDDDGVLDLDAGFRD